MHNKYLFMLYLHIYLWSSIMMHNAASLSNSCTPDRCKMSSPAFVLDSPLAFLPLH